MTIKETHYLFGRLPVHSRTAKPSESFTIIERNLGRFAYGESKVILTVKDKDTINALALPFRYRWYAEYSDLLPASQPNPEETQTRSIREDEINDLPKLPGRIPHTQRRFTWKP